MENLRNTSWPVSPLILGPLCVFALIVPMASLALFVQRDYQKYLSLGPGANPQTFFGGYTKVKALSLLALRDAYKANIPIPGNLLFRDGRLGHLPERRHSRPKTEGIAPHRQVEQQGGAEMFQKLAAAIEAFAPGANNDFAIGTSCYEKNSDALFAVQAASQRCRREVVHVHSSDGSMHVTLHPADANTVLRSGWGERHPLAGVLSERFVPEEFMMVYAPQNDEEMEVVLDIIRAACWFISAGIARVGA